MPPEPETRLRTRLAIAWQRKLWTKRAPSWGTTQAPDLSLIVDAVCGRVPPSAEAVLDLGSGTGALALRLAPRVDRVTAVDVSHAMTDALRSQATARHLENITAITAPAEALELRPSSFDVVVTNYAMHHLRDADKARVVRAAAHWLRPGGRIIIGDMMFGRGAASRDREIIASKLGALARKGPGGWWRIAKNVVRFLLRLQERPLTIDAWIDLLEAAGFVDVTAAPVVAEAAVVMGRLPLCGAEAAPAQPGAPGQWPGSGGAKAA